MRGEDPISCLHRLQRFGARFGLEHVKQMLMALGDPQLAYPVVHVAGTNGKGSTSAMIASCLEQGGYRVGLFTSPHLSRFSERVRVDGREIDYDDLSRLVDVVLERCPGATFFEAATLLALLYFSEQRVDLAVLEAGLGGRLDATNAVSSTVCLLTAIGLDHQAQLGKDLASIAEEKAGIIKLGVPVISSNASEPAQGVIARRASDCRAPLSVLGRDFSMVRDGALARYQGLGISLDHLELALRGDHQLDNAALALAAIEVLGRHGIGAHVGASHLRAGLSCVRWPGRLEWVRRPTAVDVLLDGAHNSHGIAALVRALSHEIGAPAGQVTLIFGTLQDKDSLEMARALIPFAGAVIVTRPRSDRASDPASLAAQIGAHSVATLREALALAERVGRPILIAGSLYLIGEARSYLLSDPCDRLPTSDPI
jgi:dihydrofolate synthase/folylpolyglutamate synthase